MNTLRVAVVGASGIGKNHARWFAGHGCDVCAFVGSSPASIADTQRVLQASIGFDGRGYVSLEEMLREEQPDAVCISSPPHLHYEQALQCLDAGAHVLCEKPLVGDETRPAHELIVQARHLVQHAANCDRLLGTQMQYAIAVDEILRLCEISHPNQIREFSMTMETKNIKHGRRGREIWIDLAPHPLSVLATIAPEAVLDEGSIRTTVGDQHTRASFTLYHDNFPIEAGIHVAVNAERAVPRRAFTINNRTIEYSARNNASGVFCSYLKSESGEEVELPDFVDTLIGNFVQACRGEAELQVKGSDGALVVEWLLQIIALG
jgi:predicted dehydrogenase